MVAPGKNGGPPADAIVLFNGTDLAQFEASEWKVQDGVIVAAKGHLTTKRAFGDIQLHVEWAGPRREHDPLGQPGNSGINLMGQYEVQVRFDSHSTNMYADGGAGAIYGQGPPLANATLPRGEWQTYDIVFKAPVFEGGKLVKPARVTVFHNGIVIQNGTEILGPSTHRKILPYTPKPAKLPFAIMGHNCPMKFRNIWVRELSLP